MEMYISRNIEREFMFVAREGSEKIIRASGRKPLRAYASATLRELILLIFPSH
ncbi:unnamed protein product, partial [Nesidiocoris tenuis]